MPYGDFKDVPLRTASDRILLDKAFKIDKNPKYRRCERGLGWMDYNFLIKSGQKGLLKVLHQEFN